MDGCPSLQIDTRQDCAQLPILIFCRLARSAKDNSDFVGDLYEEVKARKVPGQGRGLGKRIDTAQ